jgi:outer membrane lipoprotein carrier protein
MKFESTKTVVGSCLANLGFVCLVGIFVASTASAQQEDEGQRLLNTFVNDVHLLSARFEQSLVDADDIILETSSGTVDIQRPGRFRWAYSDPYEQILIADGLNVWSYDVDLEQVTVKPQATVLSNTPALLLGGSSGVLDDFDYIGSFEDRGTVWVRLRPKNSNNGFSKVELGFTDGDLTRMLFSDTLDQTTLIALLDITMNKPLAEDFFEFVPPDNVDLVGIPVSRPMPDVASKAGT